MCALEADFVRETEVRNCRETIEIFAFWLLKVVYAVDGTAIVVVWWLLFSGVVIVVIVIVIVFDVDIILLLTISLQRIQSI